MEYGKMIQAQLLGFVMGLQGYRVCCVWLHNAFKQTDVGILRDNDSVLFT